MDPLRWLAVCLATLLIPALAAFGARPVRQARALSSRKLLRHTADGLGGKLQLQQGVAVF